MNSNSHSANSQPYLVNIQDQIVNKAIDTYPSMGERTSNIRRTAHCGGAPAHCGDVRRTSSGALRPSSGALSGRW